MPIGIPIQAIPNQSLTVTLDGNLYEMTIKSTNGQMSVSIVRDGSDIIDNARAAACAAIIPAKYQESGNFIFLTANNQLPDYKQFGLTQSLLYLSADELTALRIQPTTTTPSKPTVTASNFNPIAQLPLRFAPQGYTEGA